MRTETKKVAVIYGAWSLFWLFYGLLDNAFTGYGEYGSHLLLTTTGFPLAFLSWFFPQGSTLATFIAGLLGLIQWCILTEAV